MTFADLPLLNAILNSTTTVLLLCGWWQIRHGNARAHAMFMASAVVTSSLFLASYLIHKFTMGPTAFQGQGWIRPVYFTILISHTILAIVNLPLIISVVVLAIRGKFEKHRRLARWTLPSWLYVSITGVVVYLMLYQWFKQ